MNSKVPEGLRVQSQKVARSKRFHKPPTEDQEQIALISWAHKVKYGNGRLSDYLIHIPNGGSRNVIEASKFKKMGVKAGVPDLQLLIPNGLIHGLWIETQATKAQSRSRPRYAPRWSTRFGSSSASLASSRCATGA